MKISLRNLYPKIFGNNFLFAASILHRQKPVMVNLGCGDRLLEGWINADSGSQSGLLKGVVPFDARFPYRVRNEVSFIYCSHMIEHLESWEAREFLKRCFEMLEEGGCLRIVTPDLDTIIAKFLVRDEKFFTIPAIGGYSRKELDEHYFGGGYITFEDLFLGSFYSSEFFRRLGASAHKYLYNYSLLEKRCQNAGFTKVVRCTCGDNNLPEVSELELTSGYKGYSLYVEAYKPQELMGD